jgi:hypothetical protein
MNAGIYFTPPLMSPFSMSDNISEEKNAIISTAMVEKILKYSGLMLSADKLIGMFGLLTLESWSLKPIIT